MSLTSGDYEAPWSVILQRPIDLSKVRNCQLRFIEQVLGSRYCARYSGEQAKIVSGIMELII